MQLIIPGMLGKNKHFSRQLFFYPISHLPPTDNFETIFFTWMTSRGFIFSNLVKNFLSSIIFCLFFKSVFILTKGTLLDDGHLENTIRTECEKKIRPEVKKNYPGRRRARDFCFFMQTKQNKMKQFLINVSDLRGKKG